MTVFISYRRADTQQAAGRLYGQLAQRFGEPNVVIDIATDQIGRDYRQVIYDELDRASVVLALIGQDFLEGEAGRRIHEEHDLVRLELAKALELQLPIVPVLIDGARLPTPSALPDDIAEIVFRGGVDVTHTRFQGDADYLADRIAHLVQPVTLSSVGLETPKSSAHVADRSSNPAAISQVSDDPVAAVRKGFQSAVSEVRPAFGPTGVFAITVGEGGRGPKNATGRGIVMAMTSDDSGEQVGIDVARSIASSAHAATRDGTTTALILADSMSRRALKHIRAGLSIAAVRRGIEAASDSVVEALRNRASTLTASGTLTFLDGTGIREEDRDAVAAAIEQVGTRGVMTTTDGYTNVTSVSYVSGYQFGSGFLSPHFATDPDENIAVFERPYIATVAARISQYRLLLPILEQVLNEQRPLLVIAEDVDGEALAVLVVNHIRGSLRSTAVRAPGAGMHGREVIADVAAVVGATTLSESDLERAELRDLGSAERAIITPDTTTIISGDGQDEGVAARVVELRRLHGDTSNSWDREDLETRVRILSEGVAVVEVGADGRRERSTAARSRRQLVEAAINAVSAADRGGVVQPAGVELALIAADMSTTTFAEPLRPGAECVIESLTSPLAVLAENAGLDNAELLRRLAEDPESIVRELSQAFGLDEQGLADPTETVAAAVHAAAQGAVQILLTRTVRGTVVDRRTEEPASQDESDDTD